MHPSSLAIVAALSLSACAPNGEPASPDAPGSPGPDAAVDAPSTAVGGVTVVDLGPVVTGREVVLAIPANTLGFQLVVEVDAAAGTEPVAVAAVTSPSGQQVIIDSALPEQSFPIGATSLGIASVTIPQSSATAATPVEVGPWKLRFEAPDGKTTRARAYVRTTVDGKFHGGTLDVRFYIPDAMMIADPGPAHAITAATAADDVAVMTRVDSMFATLAATYQLERGAVEFIPLPARFASIATDDVRLEALALTTPTSDGFGMHVILTNELRLFDSQVWGSSPWIPGVANAANRRLGALVVDVTLGFPAVADGMTMVHEFGHFFGLFHSTEGDRTTHDPIEDTAECGTAGAITLCPDRKNIMFFAFYGASGGTGLTASAHQQRVVWSSSAYRAR